MVALRRTRRFSTVAIAKFVQWPYIECFAGIIGEDRAIQFGQLDMEYSRCGNISISFAKEFHVCYENS